MLLVVLGGNAWRYMYLLGGILAVIIFILRIGLPESPRCLAAKGREKEAQEVIYNITGNTVEVEPIEMEKAKLKDLFANKNIRNSNIFVFGLWFCYAMASYGIYLL